MDRTRDFLRLAGEAVVAPVPQSNSLPLTLESKQRERSKQGIFFNERAAEVFKGIHNCSVLLSRLTVLAKTQTLFHESDESSSLQVKVNAEMKQLKHRLGELQTWLKQNDLGQGKDAKSHSELVVRNMEFKLQDSGKQFQQVLESRKQALRIQLQRKRMFANEEEEDVDIGVPVHFLEVKENDENDDDVEQQRSQRMTSQNIPFALQQRQLIPDNQFLRSRVDAISTVESHITELGQVMSTLATMVSEQDHLVDRFGENVDRSVMDMRSGFLQLEKYYESIRGNKRLMTRLFGVVVAFLFFFLFFLA